jgi:hypothetical protein
VYKKTASTAGTSPFFGDKKEFSTTVKVSLDGI